MATPPEGNPLAICVQAVCDQLRVLSGPFEKLADEFGRLDGAVNNWKNKNQNDGQDQFVAIGKICAAIKLSALVPMFLLLRTASSFVEFSFYAFGRMEGYHDTEGACLKEAFIGRTNVTMEKRNAWYKLAAIVYTFKPDGQSELQQGIDGVQENGATGTGTMPFHQVRTNNDAAPGNGTMCILCMEKMINTSFYPCGHACTCDLCDAKLQREAAGRPHQRTCPLCRTVIKESRRMIISGVN